MATYRVIRKGHWVEGKMVPPGGMVEIQGDLPASLADRLEPVSEVIEQTEGTGKEGANPWRTLPQSIIDLLVGAGFENPGLVRSATDDKLLSIEGIGAAKVKVIREILA